MPNNDVSRDISDLISRIDTLPLRGRYGMIHSVISGLSPELLRRTTCTLTELFEERSARLRLPDSVLPVYRNDINRIHDETLTQPDSFYSSDNDVFVKDFCIASQRMIPAGAQVLHEHGISRRNVLRARGRETINAALFFLGTKGFAPFYEIHTHYPVLSEFNEEGWKRCYRRIADLLRVNPHVKGMAGSSWFFDSVVAKVSPRLAYLRDIPVEHGALSICLGSDEASISLATKTSETRRKLYEGGQYLPTSYLLVWDRWRLIKWADRPDG